MIRLVITKEKVSLWLAVLIDKDKLTKIRNKPITICHQNCGGTVKKNPIVVAQAKTNNNQEGLAESFWPCFIGFALLGW